MLLKYLDSNISVLLSISRKISTTVFVTLHGISKMYVFRMHLLLPKIFMTEYKTSRLISVALCILQRIYKYILVNAKTPKIK